jgi:hypothetical protein
VSCSARQHGENGAVEDGDADDGAKAGLSDAARRNASKGSRMAAAASTRPVESSTCYGEPPAGN